MRIHCRFLGVAALLSVVTTWTGAASAQCLVNFNQTAADRLTIETPSYTLAIAKANGAILSILDKGANASLTLGSQNGHLWGALFPPGGAPEFVGGGSYPADRFSYSWSQTANALTLSYAEHPNARITATVRLAVSCEPYFDLSMNLQNFTGREMIELRLPSELLFAGAAIEEAHAPFFLPGVSLQGDFFRQGRTWAQTYPTREAFADYVSLRGLGTHLALYTVNPDGPVRPVIIGFVGAGANFHALHNFRTAVPNGGVETTPVVRIRIGQPVEQTAVAYRNENGMGAFPSVAAKLGDRLDSFLDSPLVKFDAVHYGRAFSQYDFSALAAPLFFHLAAYMPGGHDRSYPDVLPPDTRWGSLDDLIDLARRAQAQGMYFTPYWNPLWWTDGSASLANLPAPLTVGDICVRKADGSCERETYNGQSGVFVSPCHPYVRSRLGGILSQWRDLVGVDSFFLDQVGAIQWLADYNPASPSPTRFADCWIDFLRPYAGMRLHTEDGYDRLARDFVAFHGSLLRETGLLDTADQVWRAGEGRFGAGNSQPYPLASLLFGDKVLLFQHDLDPRTMAHTPGLLTFNLAFGFGLSFIPPGITDGAPGQAWADLVLAAQRIVAKRSAGRQVQSFRSVNASVTETRWDGMSVFANRHASQAHDTGAHMIAPGGFLAASPGEDVLAGAFVQKFNGSPLSAGVHYLFVEKSASSTTVRQPVGAGTSVAVPPPAAGVAVRVTPIGKDQAELADVLFNLVAGAVVFDYNGVLNGVPVDRYEVRPVGAACTYTPDRPAMAAAAGGDTLAITVRTSQTYCSWRAQSNDPWISVNSSPRRGTQPATLAIAANPLAASREGTVTAAGRVIRIVQPGAGCQFSLDPQNIAAQPAGGALDIGVLTASGCAWSAVSPASWISIANAQGAGNGTFRCNLTQNPGPSPRAASVSVAGQLTQVAQGAAAPSQTFQDVALSHPYFNYISLMQQERITSGCTATAYCPDAITTRSQMAVFIVRALLGTDDFAYPGTAFFNDVPVVHPHFKYVQKMRELGITSGCTAASYCPDNPITRGQMAVFLIRARLALRAGDRFLSYPLASAFADVPSSHDYFGFVQKMKQLAVTSGCTATQYCPESPTTRGQMAVFVVRGLLSP